MNGLEFTAHALKQMTSFHYGHQIDPGAGEDPGLRCRHSGLAPRPGTQRLHAAGVPPLLQGREDGQQRGPQELFLDAWGCLDSSEEVREGDSGQ